MISNYDILRQICQNTSNYDITEELFIHLFIFYGLFLEKSGLSTLGYSANFDPKGYHPWRVLRAYVPDSEYPAPPALSTILGQKLVRNVTF